MSQPNQALRTILTQVAEAWDGEIEGRMKSATGEVLMHWKWDREKKVPVRVEG